MSSSLYSTAIHEAAHAVAAVRTASNGKHGLAKNGVVTIDADGDTLGSIRAKRNSSGPYKHRRDIIINFGGGMAEYMVTQDRMEISGSMTDIRRTINRLAKLWPSDVLNLAVDLQFHRTHGKPPAPNATEFQKMVDPDTHRYRTRTVEEFIQDNHIDAGRVKQADYLFGRIRSAITWFYSTNTAAEAAQKLILAPDGLAIIQEPWFKILGDLADKTHGLLHEHWGDIHRLANKLLEVGTMTGPEAEAFIKNEPVPQPDPNEQRLRKEVSQVRRAITRLWESEPVSYPGCKPPRGAVKAWREMKKKKLPALESRLFELEAEAKTNGWKLAFWWGPCTCYTSRGE